MDNITIQVFSNRKLSKKSVNIGNYHENNVTKLIFEMDEDIIALGGNVYLFLSYDGSSYPYPLVDNSVVIGSELTSRKKIYANIVVSTSEGDNVLDGTIWISDTFLLMADKNNINVDDINEQELPEQLKIVYEDLLKLKGELTLFFDALEIDSELSEKSENPVQNKVVAEALTDKADTIISKASGQFISIKDSAKAKPKNIRLLGGSKQRQYEGYQLFDAKTCLAKQIKLGVVTVNDDGSIILNGTFNSSNRSFVVPMKAGSYYFRESSKILHQLSNGDAHWVNSNANEILLTFEEDTELSCYIGSDTYTNTVIEPMISVVQGAELEPYVGGQPSPNINYPQPINHLGESGSIVGKVLTSNLVDYEDKNGYFVKQDNGKYKVSKTNSNVINGSLIPLKDILKPNIPYTITGGGVDGLQVIISTTVSGTSKYLGIFHVGNGKAVTFTPKEEEIENAKMYLQLIGNTPIGEYEVYYMLNVGTEAFPFEPYTEQPFTVLTPNGLKGIGDVRDEKDYEQNENIQRIYKQVLDGNSQIVRLDDDLAEHTTTRFTIQLDYAGLNGDANVMCTHSLFKIMWMEDVEGFYVDGNAVVFRVNSAICGTTQDEVIAWLQSEYDKGTPVEVHYVLAEPIETDLTEEEMAQYNALIMNKGNNTLLNDAGAMMELEQVCDTQLHIEQNYIPRTEHEALKTRVSDIEQAIANL